MVAEDSDSFTATRDVIIVGAGPAGGMLAYDLAKEDVDVLIIEKERLPRYKPCGGGLPVRVRSLIDFDLDSVVEQKINGFIYSYKLGDTVVERCDQVLGWTVMRDKLDSHILSRALDVGAEVIDGLRVTNVEDKGDIVIVKTQKGNYHAKILVGADGVNSTVGSAIGLRSKKRNGIALECWLYTPSENLPGQVNLVQFDFGTVPRGYAWVFPRKGHFSVGVFSTMPKVKGIRGCLDRFIENHEVLRGFRCSGVRACPIPLGGSYQALQRGRVLLIGDAAGLADPILGEGIYYALKSGHLAAKVIKDAFARGDIDLSEYTPLVNREIVSELRIARKCAFFMYNFPRLTYKALIKRYPSVSIDMARGKYTYSDTLGRLIGTRLRILGSRLWQIS